MFQVKVHLVGNRQDLQAPVEYRLFQINVLPVLNFLTFISVVHFARRPNE